MLRCREMEQGVKEKVLRYWRIEQAGRATLALLCSCRDWAYRGLSCREMERRGKTV